MKKLKIILGGLLLVSSIGLTSCLDLSEDDNPSDTSSDINNPNDNTSSNEIKKDDVKKKDKYEVLDADYTIWTDGIGDRMIKISIPVKNTGETDLHLGSMSCDIESKNGKLLQTLSYISGYPDYIKPGETGYYYEEHSCDFTEEEVNIIPHTKIEHASVKMIRYDVSDISISEDDFWNFKIVGRVSNNTDEDGTFVEVCINLFDINDKLICTEYTYLKNDLQAGDRVGFTINSILSYDVKVEDIARYEAYSYPMQINW